MPGLPQLFAAFAGLGELAIAYFSPEYGITSVLPQYSGGLGILAGDHLKTASDLGVPLIGVGLLYQHGYFRQQFSREGWQQETYPVLDPDGLPITPLREADGTPAQVSLEIPGDHPLLARIGRPLGAWFGWYCSAPAKICASCGGAGKVRHAQLYPGAYLRRVPRARSGHRTTMPDLQRLRPRDAIAHARR